MFDELDAARIAEGQFVARQKPGNVNNKDMVFGYKLACAQMALVFRAMRKGQPPTPEEFEAVRAAVAEEVGFE